MKYLAPSALWVICGLSFIEAKPLTVDTQEEWQNVMAESQSVELKEGRLTPKGKQARFTSKVQQVGERQKLKSVEFQQAPDWLNWKSVSNIGPKNAKDAPVFLSLGDGDYYLFARYDGGKVDTVHVETLKLEEQVFLGKLKRAEADKRIHALKKKGVAPGAKGGNVAAKDPKQSNGTGGTELGLGGYHCWHSTDMENWVHHGPVSDYRSRWMTTAEYVDGKFYLYYDNPNDQDPHLIIDSDVKDGKIGVDKGMVFKDPSDGSDNAVIRSSDGKFHLIYEDWSPLNASKQAWDSPLAGRAISSNGVDWKIQKPAIDHRTKPTGNRKKYKHPHQPQLLEYEEHLPKQDAYGDWAAIQIGEQYYLFGDFDPAKNKKKNKGMSCAWFTSADINSLFEFAGNIGQGHPDPDITFAEGQFYLITQFSKDFVSPGPWVDGVKARAGVDTDGDGAIDQWTEWQSVKERYHHTPGFAKVVSVRPALLDTSSLAAGVGFAFELQIEAPNEGKILPVLDKVLMDFE
jgi:hypothetical protein